MNLDVTFTESDSTFSAEFSEGLGTGENGATFIPSVSADGVLSWINDKGLPNPDPVNIKGENGRGILKFQATNLGDYVYYQIQFTDGAIQAFKIYHGKDGHTPIKGIDYFTEADKAELVSEVLAAVVERLGL